MHELRSRLGLLLSFVALMLPGSARAEARSIEAALRDVVTGRLAAEKVSFTYTDLHRLWNDGTQVTVRGDGFVTEAPGPDTKTRTYRITRAEVHSLVALLVEVRGWEQVPLRVAPPDERPCRLSISVGDLKSEVVEWGTDLGRNDRLLRVLTRLRRLGPHAESAQAAVPAAQSESRVSPNATRD